MTTNETRTTNTAPTTEKCFVCNGIGGIHGCPGCGRPMTYLALRMLTWAAEDRQDHQEEHWEEP